MAQLQHTMAWYGTLWSSTTIKTLFVIVLKIAITECQNHDIPAVQCMEIALHSISPCDQHLPPLSSSITRLVEVSSMMPYTPFSNCHTIWRFTITCNQSLGILSHWKTHTVCLTISTSSLFPFNGSFNLPSLILLLHTLPYSLCSEKFTFQIHLFTFKFVSFIFTPYKILLLHSHHIAQ